MPALSERFNALAMSLPPEVAPYGQGVHVRLNPDMPLLKSNLLPWVGTFNDPGFKEQALKKYEDLQKLYSTLGTGTSRRHAKEVDRAVRMVHRGLGQIPIQDMGVTLELGMMNLAKVGGPQQVLAKAKPATVRDMHVMLAYFLSGATPPESADMGRFTPGRRDALTGRHAVRLALEGEGGTASRYMFGASTSEHLRRLNLAQHEPFHMMASVGLQSPQNAPKNVFTGEQMFSHPNRVQQLSDFEQKLLAGTEQDVARALRASKSTGKALRDAGKLKSVGTSFRDILTDVLTETSQPLVLTAPGGLVAPGKSPNFTKEFWASMVDRAEEAVLSGRAGNPPKVNTPQYFQAMLRWSNSKLLDIADKINERHPGRRDFVELIRGFQQNFISSFKNRQEAMKQVREVGKTRPAARATRDLAKNPGAVMRTSKEMVETFKKIGVSVPKTVPAILVAALLAGTMAIGAVGEEAA